jgi:hypothetical protein
VPDIKPIKNCILDWIANAFGKVAGAEGMEEVNPAPANAEDY